MTKARKEKHRQEIQRAEEFARKALTAVSRKPVSEAKVRQVAKKVARTMTEALALAADADEKPVVQFHAAKADTQGQVGHGATVDASEAGNRPVPTLGSR